MKHREKNKSKHSRLTVASLSIFLQYLFFAFVVWPGESVTLYQETKDKQDIPKRKRERRKTRSTTQHDTSQCENNNLTGLVQSD